MTNWENNFAASMMYQDLADCTLGTVPVSVELEQAKDAKGEKEIKNENQNTVFVNILKKASIFLFLLVAVVTELV